MLQTFQALVTSIQAPPNSDFAFKHQKNAQNQTLLHFFVFFEENIA